MHDFLLFILHKRLEEKPSRWVNSNKFTNQKIQTRPPKSSKTAAKLRDGFAARWLAKNPGHLLSANRKIRRPSLPKRKMADKDKEKKPDLGLLEEDDEFEEFPAEGLY